MSQKVPAFLDLIFWCILCSVQGTRFYCFIVPKLCLLGNKLEHGETTCTNGTNPGSVCSFECEQFFIAPPNEPDGEPTVVASAHELIGPKQVVCRKSLKVVLNGYVQ